MQEEKQGFVFLPSYYEAIRELPPAERLAVYDALCQYALEGAWPEPSNGIVRTILLLIRPTLDKSRQKYQSAVEHGKKGGNPNFRKGQSNPYYPKHNPEDNPGDNQDKDKEKEKDRDKAMDTAKEREEAKESPVSGPAAADAEPPAGTYGNVLLSSGDWERVKKNFPTTWQFHVNRLSALIHAGTPLPRPGHCDAILALAERDMLRGKAHWPANPSQAPPMGVLVGA